MWPESYDYCYEPYRRYPIVKPNLITGEGRMRIRGDNKQGDLKKRQHRKMAKKSRRKNRK